MHHFRKELVQTYGVIGNTAGFGPVILGSSPSRSTKEKKVFIIAMKAFFVGIILVSWSGLSEGDEGSDISLVCST